MDTVSSGLDEAVSSGWCADENGVTYPAPPWQLQGELYASLWPVPVRSFPAFAPSGFRPVTLFGQTLVGTAWAHYEPGGVLAYNEVLAAWRIRGPDGTATHVPLIWVDHPSSAAGARALWGIPKRLATFWVISTRAAFEAAADADGQAIASIRFRPRLPLPGRWPLQTRLAHSSPDGIKVTQARLSARITFGSTKWQFAPEGPLAFLASHTPLMSVRFSETALTFGLPGWFGESIPSGDTTNSRLWCGVIRNLIPVDKALISTTGLGRIIRRASRGSA